MIETHIPRSRLFRFENFWPLHPGFQDTVQRSWSKPVLAANSAQAIAAKFKRLRCDLKHWSRSISKLSIAIENCNKFLGSLDEIEDKRTLTRPEWNCRVILKRHLLRLLDYKNKYWKKRCTFRWAKLGDENTNFFHARATERYMRNNIAMLKGDDGRILDTHAEMAAAFHHAFKQRMGVSTKPEFCLDLQSIIQPIEGLEALSAPFTHAEIDEVIKKIPVDKAPGPDGFNGMFLKTCWNIIREDFYQLCQDFWEGNLTLQSLNNSLITLIPKTLSPEKVNDYRPISLLNCALKVITKLMADRLQKWILLLVHRNQYGFIKSRTIQDCLAWSFEYLHQCHASGAPCVVLKIDFEKAFDTVEHHAILEILRAKGFDNKWINMVSLILDSGTSSVLLNGVPGSEFRCRRGVRQGDPLSPLLFVAMGDLLQTVVNAAHFEGHLQLPIEQPAGEDYPIIQYADDTLAVIPATTQQINTMKCILQSYAISTGLKINFSKTQLIPINISNEEANALAETIGCKVAAMPFTYLGLPMGTSRPTVEELMPLVCAVERRLSSSALWLTYGGRLTYVNSAITPLMTFAMCTLKIPLKIFEFCDRARRHCLWRKFVDGEEKCQSLASWDRVCQPKTKGGLGIINLQIQNKALLLKHLDKFYKREDIPWVQLVWYKHYPEGVPHAQAPCGSFWWRDAMGLNGIFRGAFTCEIKDGDSILLWKDPWKDPPLCDRAARLYSFALQKDVSVSDFINRRSLEEQFVLPLSIEAHAELLALEEELNDAQPERQIADEWRPAWGADQYRAKDFYLHCFRACSTPHHVIAIWKSKCMMKHKVFAWLMFVDRLNTRQMLRRRNYNIGTDFSCLTCDTGATEARNHLFFMCSFGASCWAKIGITWNGNLQIEDMLLEAKTRWNKPLFTEVLILGAWNIWKTRNRVYFDGEAPSIQSWQRQLSQDLSTLTCRVKDSHQGLIKDLLSKISH
jgi:hypothetical protein